MEIKNWHVALAIGVGTAAVVVALPSCVAIPKGAKAVSNFDLDRYLGKWYEIARLDFKFERHLNNVTATYSANKNGSIRVDNRGFDTTKNKWKESIGTAKPVNKSREGRLKVSFFGPFYAGYNVIEIDNDYQYAMVCGNNLNYLWILSRTKNIPEEVRQNYLLTAEKLGYKIDKLVWCRHDE